jgi:hypothetical protein
VISKPYTLTLTLSLKGEGINGWALDSHWFAEYYELVLRQFPVNAIFCNYYVFYPVAKK